MIKWLRCFMNVLLSYLFQELDLDINPKPLVFILHSFLAAKLSRLGLAWARLILSKFLPITYIYHRLSGHVVLWIEIPDVDGKALVIGLRTRLYLCFFVCYFLLIYCNIQQFAVCKIVTVKQLLVCVSGYSDKNIELIWMFQRCEIIILHRFSSCSHWSIIFHQIVVFLHILYV